MVIAFSGQPGGPSDVFVAGNLAAVMDAVAARHHGVAPVVVVPDQLGSYNFNPECENSKMGNVAQYVTDDVREWTLKHLPVSSNRRDWTVAGFSQGATCAVQFGTEYPAIFGSYLAISPGVGPINGTVARSVREAFHGSLAAWKTAQPIAIMQRKRPYRHTYALYATGVFDKRYSKDAVALVAASHAAGMQTSFDGCPASHTTGTRDSRLQVGRRSARVLVGAAVAPRRRGGEPGSRTQQDVPTDMLPERSSTIQRSSAELARCSRAPPGRNRALMVTAWTLQRRPLLGYACSAFARDRVAVAALLVCWVAAIHLREASSIPGSRFDAAWAVRIDAHHTHIRDVIANTIAVVGGAPGGVLVDLGVATLVLLLRGKAACLTVVAALAVNETDVLALKWMSERHPPGSTSLYLGFLGSFPSGHTANAAVIVVSIGLLAHRLPVWAGGAAYVAVMGVDRTYLDAHWVTDTIAGAVAGAAIAALIWSVALSRNRDVAGPVRH